MCKSILSYFGSGILILLTSCVTDYKGDFPDVASLPVLNATICSDSLLKATLTWSLPPKSGGAASAITNASVDLYVNGYIKSALQNMGEGKFELPSSVVLHKDSLYTLKAYGSGFDTIVGSTMIPQMPKIELTTLQTGYTYGHQLNITDTVSTYSALWIYVCNVDSTNSLVDRDVTLFGDGRLADDFNRSVDASGTMSGGSFIYVYDKCIRIDRQSLVNGIGEMQFTASTNGVVNVYVLAASPEYDKYCKGAFMQEIESLNLELPFTYNNVMVPSNISNGIGVFGGYSLQAFRVNYNDFYYTQFND